MIHKLIFSSRSNHCKCVNNICFCFCVSDCNILFISYKINVSVFSFYVVFCFFVVSQIDNTSISVSITPLHSSITCTSDWSTLDLVEHLWSLLPSSLDLINGQFGYDFPPLIYLRLHQNNGRILDKKRWSRLIYTTLDMLKLDNIK